MHILTKYDLVSLSNLSEDHFNPTNCYSLKVAYGNRKMFLYLENPQGGIKKIDQLSG